MPENWKTHNLSDGIETIIDYRGKTPRKSPTGIPLISAANIKNGKLNFSKASYISRIDYEKWTTRGFTKPKDVLITTEAPVGEVALYPDDGQTYLISRRVIALRTDERLLHSKFLFYLLQYKPILNSLLSNNRGSTVPRVLKTDITGMQLKLPAYSEQIAIASILSALDDKIELNLQMNKTLEDMAMALYKHWFVDFGPFQDEEFVDSELGEIPKGWEVKKLGDVADVGSSKRIFRNEYVEYGIPFFRGKEIIQLSQGKSISTELFIKTDKFNSIKEKFGIPQKDDILISSVGTIGVSWLVENNKPFYFKDGNLTWIKNYKPEVNGHFISQWLKSPSTQDQIKGETIGSTQQALTISALRTLKIALPKDESYVEEISGKLKLWNTALVSNRKEIEILTQLRDTLLPKLISGEVRVKDVEKTLSKVL